MKIILSDLEKHLFPEKYPYFSEHFSGCLEYLKQNDEESKNLKNLNFFLKLTKLSVAIKDEDVRLLSGIIFEKTVEQCYDWHKPYDWHELKLFLIFFMYFSKAKSTKEVIGFYSPGYAIPIFKKYLPVQE